VGFEPTIAVLERAKTVRALDRSDMSPNKDRSELRFTLKQICALHGCMKHFTAKVKDKRMKNFEKARETSQMSPLVPNGSNN
jgi:hypothetical protein